MACRFDYLAYTLKEQFITAPFFFYASAYSNTYFDPPNP